MALIPIDRYPAQVDADAAYPHGKARNAGSFQDGTGTPLEKDWLNDDWGFKQALLAAAGIAPSGTPDAVGASQYLDALRATTSAAHLAERALQLREVPSSVALTDVQNSLGAVRGRTRGHGTILLKAAPNGVGHVWNWPPRDAKGSVKSITSKVCGAARFNGPGAFRVVAIGTGGNFCCFSDNEGVDWTAGADLGAVPHDIIANQAKTKIMVTFAAVHTVSYGADGTAWTNASPGLTTAQGGIAWLENGDTVVGGRDADFVAFSVSDDGGVTWDLTSEGLPNFGDYQQNEPGWICGQGRPLVFHVGRVLGRTQLRLCSSADGVTWELAHTFASPSGDIGLFFASNPRIFMCAETGLLVVTCTLDNGPSVAYASTDQGVTWSAPMLYALNGPIAAAAWGVASGRVFATIGNRLFASDGIARP